MTYSRKPILQILILGALILALSFSSVSASPTAILTPTRPLGHFTTAAYSFPPAHIARGGTMFQEAGDLLISTNDGQTWDVVTFSEEIEPVLDPAQGMAPRSSNTLYRTYEVRAIATSPDYPNDGTVTAIVMSDQHPLAISRDWGKTWTQNNSQRFSQAVFSPHYKIDHTIYTTSPMLKSTDGGLTWTPIEPSGIGYYRAILISPNYANDHEVFATWQDTNFKYFIMRSNDDVHWYPADNGLLPSGATLYQLFFVSGGLSNNGHSILVASTGTGIYTTENSGDSWSQLSNRRLRKLSISKNPTSGQLEIIGNDPTTGRFIYSLDSGATWTGYKLYPDQADSPVARDLVVSPDYAQDHTLYGTFLNTPGYWKSTDKGLNWQLVKTPAREYADDYDLLVSPTYETDRTLMVYAKANPYSSTPAPTSWFKSGDGGRSWVQMPLPFVHASGMTMRMALSPQYSSDHTILIAYDKYLYRSTDGGDHWAFMGTPTANAIGELKLSSGYPTDPTLFVVTVKNEVFHSNDNAASWKTFQPPTTYKVKEVVLSPNYASDHIVIVNCGVMYFSNNFGDTWVELANPTPFGGLVDISPNFASDHTLFWAADGSSDGAIFKSTDGGNHWTQVHTADMFVKSVVISPNYAQDQTVMFSRYQSYPILTEDGGDTFVALPTMPGFSDVGIAYENGLAVFFASSAMTYRYEWPTLDPIQPVALTARSSSSSPARGLINLGNSLNAPITWNAASNAGWLTSAAPNGTVPDKISLNANPTGLTGNNQAQLTLDVYFSKQQKTRVNVPVSLLVNNHMTWIPAAGR